jgi:hypothetical protein
MLHGIFVGRWEKEKWIDLLIVALEKIAIDHSQELNMMKFSFFWEWSYRSALERLVKKYPKLSLTLWGWKDKKSIETYCHQNPGVILIMPSVFLETFWLVAGEALSRWVPVCTNNIWWTAQFLISTEFAINSYPSLAALIRHFSTKSPEDYSDFTDKAKKIALNYKKWTWINNINLLINKYSIATKKQQKCLFISDYKAILWGIETHIIDAAAALSPQIKTQIRWWPCKTQRARMRWQLLAGWNLFETGRLLRYILREKPTMIWRHSIQRYIWRMPLLAVWIVMNYQKSKPIHLITYHDFWLLYPYPSQLTSYHQLDQAASLKGYLSSTKKTYLKPIIFLKRIYSKLLLFILKRIITIHLVPSDYMKPIYQHHLWSSVTIETLPHFVI